ncbi:hypothetical protein [Treponema primitia]|uniref:hypothetical protein n=1 Tax=Treponema primitia TaxID=88058 RepID=UPI00047484C6|nr:hypothetical protein [Treponema primitia]
MRQLVLAALVTSLILLMSSCPTNSGIENPYNGLEDRQFWAQNLDTAKFYQLNAVKLAEGERCVIWVERTAGVSIRTAESIAKEYDINIYQKMVDVFGIQDDIKYEPTGPVVAHNTLELADWLGDGDGKLAILLLDIKDTYTPNTPGYVAGYFWAENFFDSRYSNQMDMMYVDTNPGVPGSISSNTTFAHELQHLMNYATATVRRRSNNSITFMDTWIDEGLSTAAEYVYRAPNHDDERLDWFVEDRERTIAQGNTFFVWGNHTEKSALDDYATAYLFFQWLRLQSDGTDIYRDIITSSDTDYKAVTKAAAAKIDPKYNDWGSLLGDWMAANYIRSTSGRYGYKDDTIIQNKLKVPYLPGVTSLPLYPGEGVYSVVGDTPGVFPSASGNIKYVGLKKESVPNDTALSPGGALLTYNTSTVLRRYMNELPEQAETGELTGVILSLANANEAAGAVSARSAVQPLKPFVIDARDMLRRKGYLPRMKIDVE